MDISTPTVGPIVGHTTSQECRIFLRSQAGDTAVPHFAVVRYRVKGSSDWSEPQFNRLMPSNDMSAVVLLQVLKDDTVYDYQAGWFSANTSLDNVALHSDKLNWPCTVHSFKTATTDPRRERNFIVGSCRYTHSLRDGGASAAWPGLGDQLFKVMVHKLTRQKMPIDALFLVGDQIYAGDPNLANPAVALEDFCNRYRVAFSQEGIGNILSNVPTYMILNDREIQDNWPAKATNKDKELLYPAAIKAYSIYQASHGPLFNARKSRDISGSVIPKTFWYSVANGTSDWFVLDVRTERNVQTTPNKILGDAQMTALFNWMRGSRARVKFVVTPVMFFPDLKPDEGDGWKFFPEQRDQVLEFIR
ncbi:MAG: alkaline phosphatase, partial [Pseudomonas sp.]|nr:alkaline phosphatase [Pseudomonas sp.]